MGEINYYKARNIIQSIAIMEKMSEEYGERYDINREPELYHLTHDEAVPITQKRLAEKELVETNMCLVFDFLKKFKYNVDKAEIMEDMMQEGFAIIINAIPQWDIEKGNFRVLCRVHLQKLYRTYYGEISLRPQTGIQNDAKVQKYDNACLLKNGRLESPEKAAEDLGKTAKIIKAARMRNSSSAGTLESIERLQDMNPFQDFYVLNGQITEDKNDAYLLDEEFIRSARKALRNNKYEERLIFDFLVMPDNWNLPGKEFSEVVRKATGYNFSYQQIYRAKQNIGATLVHKGILDRSFVKQNAKRLDEILKKKKSMEIKARHKWAFLFSDEAIGDFENDEGVEKVSKDEQDKPDMESSVNEGNEKESLQTGKESVQETHRRITDQFHWKQ